MTQPPITRTAGYADDDDFSILTLATLVLRRWKLIVLLGFLGGVLGLAMGLSSKRVYVSTTIFVPQGPDGPTSGLAAAASQFGLTVPSTTGSGSWGPAMYVELLHSWALLSPIVRDTFQVAEEGGRRVTLLDLLKINASREAERTDLGVEALQRMVSATEVRPLGAVRMTVTTRWPSMSHALSQRLLEALNRFNVATRKSQANAERVFVENQTREAEVELRTAEERLKEFHQRNRSVGGSAALELERDRLQRDVTLRQQVYVSLLQNRDVARIREVRDTPVITVLDAPRVPTVGKARRSAQKGMIGGILGGALAILIILVGAGWNRARQTQSESMRELLDTIQNVTPRFLRRSAR